MKKALDLKHNKKIGNIGEELACNFLKDNGFYIYERNCRLKFGEIDIVAVSYETNNNLKIIKKVKVIEVKTIISHENSKILPIDNAHMYKMRKVAKLAELYIYKNFSHETPFSIDLILVYLKTDLNLLKVEFLENLEIY